MVTFIVPGAVGLVFGAEGVLLTLNRAGPNQAGIAIATAGLLAYAFLRAGETAAFRLVHQKKVRILWANPETHKATLSWENAPAGKIPKKDGVFLLQEGARYDTPDGSVYILNRDPELGYAYRLPTRKETVDADLRLAAMSLCNPASYLKAEARSDWGAPLRANDTTEKYAWVPIVAICACITLVAILGIVLYIASKTGGH
ncbi:MAG: hypothetical protein ACYDDF_11490 [Thermoplasmatota archaeon]